MKTREKKILKEFVRQIITEEKNQKGDVGAAFGNLWNTIVGSVKMIASKTKVLLKLTKELVVTTLLKPWEKAEYEKILKEGENEYKAIKQKYPDQKIWDAIPDDLKVAFAFLYPAAFVSKQVATYGGAAIKGTFNALTDPADKKQKNKNETFIHDRFGKEFLFEDDEKKEEKPDKKKIASLTKDLNDIIKKVAKIRAPLIDELIKKMNESGESDKKAIKNLQQQLKILRSL